MALIMMKCRICGADIKADSERETVYCPHCGTPCQVERPEQSAAPESSAADTSRTQRFPDMSGGDASLTEAEMCLRLERNYGRAAMLFRQAAEADPDNWRARWGVVRAITHEFTGLDVQFDRGTADSAESAESAVRAGLDGALAAVKQCADDAFGVMGLRERRQCRPQWEDYLKRYQGFVQAQTGRRREQDLQREDLLQKRDALVRERQELSNKRDGKNEQMSRLSDQMRGWGRKQSFWKKHYPTILGAASIAAISASRIFRWYGVGTACGALLGAAAALAALVRFFSLLRKLPEGEKKPALRMLWVFLPYGAGRLLNSLASALISRFFDIGWRVQNVLSMVMVYLLPAAAIVLDLWMQSSGTKLFETKRQQYQQERDELDRQMEELTRNISKLDGELRAGDPLRARMEGFQTF